MRDTSLDSPCTTSHEICLAQHLTRSVLHVASAPRYFEPSQTGHRDSLLHRPSAPIPPLLLQSGAAAVGADSSDERGGGNEQSNSPGKLLSILKEGERIIAPTLVAGPIPNTCHPRMYPFWGIGKRLLPNVRWIKSRNGFQNLDKIIDANRESRELKEFF